MRLSTLGVYYKAVGGARVSCVTPSPSTFPGNRLVFIDLGVTVDPPVLTTTAVFPFSEYLQLSETSVPTHRIHLSSPRLHPASCGFPPPTAAHFPPWEWAIRLVQRLCRTAPQFCPDAPLRRLLNRSRPLSEKTHFRALGKVVHLEGRFDSLSILQCRV